MEDWKINPLKVVENIFENSANSFEDTLSFFREKLSEQNEYYSIPSLNDCKNERLKPNCLVRLRCMIQDMHDPEFYLGIYETRDVKENLISKKCSWFRDVVPYESHIEINMDSSQNVTQERMCYYCVPIPGEPEWIKEIYASKYVASEVECVPMSDMHKKRGLEAYSCENPNSNNVESNGANVVACAQIAKEIGDQVLNSSHKKARLEHAEGGEGENARGGSEPDNSLSNWDRLACIVKVYDEKENLCLNDCVEFVGILSVDPQLAYSNETRQFGVQSAFLTPDEDEMDTCLPPPSLVPRIHVILTRKLMHNNPLLPVHITTNEGKRAMNHVISEAQSTRGHLHAIVEQALFGDSLAADYFICHLLSSVYLRSETNALGKFTLNLSNIPLTHHFSSHLFEFFKKITTKVFMLPLTLENINTMTLIPKKDYKLNKLIPGILQLSEHTNLLLDETSLSIGQLKPQGVRNMAALGNFISWQKVEYDFGFHMMEYTANVATLVLSEGKSLLPSDCHVPLRPYSTQDVTDHFQAILTYLTPTLLDEIRRYVSVMKLAEYNVSEDLQKMIQDDFVQSRKHGASNMTDEDLHNLLILARLLSLSEGQTMLNQEMWEKARRMELERKMRLSSV